MNTKIGSGRRDIDCLQRGEKGVENNLCLFICNAQTQELCIVTDTVKKSLHLFFLSAKPELPQVLVPPMNSSISMPIKQNELHLVTEKISLRNSSFSQSVFT